MSLSVKAVLLELTSDFTTEAFIASLRRFISQRGKPSLIWSDNGSNFMGASRELKELIEFLRNQKTRLTISKFCSVENIRTVEVYSGACPPLWRTLGGGSEKRKNSSLLCGFAPQTYL